MEAYEIYIDGSKVDTLEEDYPVDLGIFDVKQMEARLADKTRVIKIPQTPTNRDILGILEDVNIDRTITGLVGRMVKGALEIKGQVVIYDTITIDGQGYYQIQIVGGNGDWVKLIQNTMLSALDFSSHDYTEANINASLTGSLDYIYPLVDYGAFLDETEVKVEDRLPAIKLASVISKIFADIGYNLQSTFLASANFAKYFMTFNGSPDIVTKEWADAQLYKVSGSDTDTTSVPASTEVLIDDAISPIPFDTEEYDYGDNYNTGTYKYTTPAAASYKFIVSLDIFVNFLGTRNYGATQPLEVTINIKTGTATLATVTWQPSDVVNFDKTLESEYYYLAQGEQVYVEVEYTENVKNEGGVSEDYDFIVISTSFIRNMILLRPAREYTWQLEQILPDISQVAFLKAVFHLFNLMVETNPFTRTVYIEPDEDFHDGSVNDWSSKLDTSKEINIMQKNIVSWLRYRMAIDGNDTEHIAYWGEVAFTNGNGKITESANQVFAHTLLDYCRRIGLEQVQIPKMWTHKEEADEVPLQLINYLSRLLYYDGNTALPSGDSWDFEGTTKTTYPKFTAPDFYDTFADYRDLMHRRMNNAQDIKLFLALDSNDINKLILCTTDADYRAKIFLDDALVSGYFFLNHIIGFIQGKATRAELTQVRASSTGVSLVQRQVGEGGGVTAGGGGSSGESGGITPPTVCSHLIIDATVISNITDADNWSGRNYTGSTTNIDEGDYYVDGNNRLYIYNGTNLYRTIVNDLI